MADSAACLLHSYSFTASISHVSHEDNPLHALSQSISFGRFMTESLEWGKWSSFSHRKYVEEAEKFSRPGSVAQKKAFFEAHYKRIAEAKKAAAAAANESPEEQAPEATVLPNASESDLVPKQEVKENTDGSGLNVERNEPEVKSIEMDAAVSEKDTAVEDFSHKTVVADDNEASNDVMVPAEMDGLLKRIDSVRNKGEDEESLTKDESAVDKVESRRSVTKSPPGWRVSVEISVPPRISDAAKKISFSDTRSARMAAHTSLKKDERPVQWRFRFLNCLMTKSKIHDQTTRKKGRKQEKKPKKQSSCFCFKPQAFVETEATEKNTKRVSRKL